MSRYDSDWWRRAKARDVCALEQLDLDSYGICKVPICCSETIIGNGDVEVREVVMYGTAHRPELFLTVEDALAHVGFCMIVSIDRHVFVEPFRKVNASSESKMLAIRRKALDLLADAKAVLPDPGHVAQGYFGTGRPLNEIRADNGLPHLDVVAPMPPVRKPRGGA